jgi:glutathione S-transferase
MMELMHSPFSTCSQKVRLCLAEKAVPWSGRVLDLLQGEQRAPEYLALNPNGVVPTLVHDGHVVIDSSVICEYLDEVFVDPPLMPPLAPGRAQVRAWMRYIEEVPTAAIRVPSFNALFSRVNRGVDRAALEAQADSMPLRKHFYLKMTDGRFGEDEVSASLERLQQTLGRMEAALGRSAWVGGPLFSLADITLIPTIVRMEDIGLSDLWAAKPAVSDWFERVQARPSFAEAFYEGSRIKPGFA